MIGMKSQLQEKTQFGIFVKLPSVEVVELVARSGFDFIILDMEHAPYTFKDVQVLTAVAQGLGLKVVIRTCDFMKNSIQYALDLGADGLQIPQINTKADVEEIVKKSKYTPLGERGVVLSSRSSRYGFIEEKEYIKQSNENILINVHIETKESLKNIEEIANTDGIDLLFLGPTDLSYSLGVDPNFVDGGLREAFDKIKDTVERAQKQMGILVSNDKQLEFALENNVKYIVWGTDTGLLKKQLSNVISTIKESQK